MINVFNCGKRECRCNCGAEDNEPHVCEHVWDGPRENIEYEGGGFSESATCSECGLSALTHDMRCI